MPALTAPDIAWHMRNYAAALQHEWITPNAFLYDWESDLLTVTRDHFVCEVEIKISRNDLLNDLKKPKHSQGMLLNGAFLESLEGTDLTTGKGKQGEKATRSARTDRSHRSARETRCRRPNYFCFAMPCDIYRKLPFGLLPPYAGVYTVDLEGRVFEERRPIQLHSEKIPLEDLLGLSRRLHYRYWDELRRGRHEGIALTLEAGAVTLEHEEALERKKGDGFDPNPTKDRLMITYPALEGEPTLEVIDASGRSILSQRLVSAASFIELDVRGWNDGLYLARVLNEGVVVGETKCTIVR